MKIAVDIMGGDFAPRELVLGAKKYLETGTADLILVGREADVRADWPDLPSRVEVLDTPEFVEMGEAPAHALRKKKRASVALAARAVKEGRAQCFISAGSTGAQMAASLLEIGRIEGIERPAISVLLPTRGERGVLALDVGANVDCRPVHLLQFALMGAAYYEKIFRVSRPVVGLLNVGAEEGKGNDLVKSVFPLLQASGLNFVGNVEGDHLFEGQVHVVVCDGFVGNVLLKACEGLSESVFSGIKAGLAKADVTPTQMQAVLSGLHRFRSDAPEYSGAPLLGLAGGSLVLHGKSRAPVVANALHLSAQFAGTDVLGLIARYLQTTAGAVGSKA